MGSVRELGEEDDRFKNIPSNIGSITINNPYMPIDQGQKYGLSTKQKYNICNKGLKTISVDYMLLNKVFTQ